MATGALGLSAASISGGAVAGAVGSATGGLVQGLGNAAYFQDSYSAKDWALGVAGGAVLGGIGGGISARVKGGPGANLMWGPNGKPNWFTNNYGGKTPSIGFGDLEFEGAEIITNIRSVLNEGAGEITNFTTTFAGQTAKLALPPPSNIALHHIFPQQFRNWFVRQGINNIDDYTIEVSRQNHLRGVHGKGYGNMPGKWNDKWSEFIKTNPNAKASEIFHFGEGLLQRYGLEHLPFKPYR